ncbi:MAG: polysaccharide deacetylase family protein [Clostridiales bacterium]|nr:polysaccharide deacetylase family protein [Clostridiales bacterium]
MKRAGKVVLCLLAVALAAYLLLIDYPALMATLNGAGEAGGSAEVLNAESSSGTVPEEDDEKADDADASATGAESLETQAAAMEEELEALYQQCEATSVALCLDQISALVYTDVYPALSDAGDTGTVVFTNSWLTGDNGRIQTSEFNRMVSAGWSYAVGGDSTLELTGTQEEIVVAWQARLETYLERIRVRSGVRPTIYCFREGEYLPDYDEILESLGFTAIQYYPEDAAEDDGEGALLKTVGIPISEETQADEVLDELRAYPGAVLVTQVTNETQVEYFLDLIEELKESDTVTITSFDAAAEAASDKEQQALRAKILEKEAVLEALEAQIDE